MSNIGYAPADVDGRERKCPRCGNTQELLFVFPKGTRVYGGCRCARTREAREAQGDAIFTLSKRLEASGVDPELRFQRSGFQRFVLTEDREAWDSARAWAAACARWMAGKGMRPVRGLGFVGAQSGTGKSHLAAAIVRHLLRRHEARIRCHVETEAVRDLRDSWQRNSGRRPGDAFADMTQARVILWDDWMADGAIDPGLRFDIVESWRQARGLVLLTSNVSVAQMRRGMQPRTWSRLRALVDFVEMRGTRDWRDPDGEAERQGRAT